MKRKLLAAAVSAVALVLGGSALAQGPGYGWGGGPGWGPGYGPGMMRGNGPGMGGYGRGSALYSLGLSDEQWEKISAIQEQIRAKNWSTMGDLRSEMFKLRRMYGSDAVDPGAYSQQQQKVDDLRRKMIASRLESRKQIESILTPEQRKQFRQWGPWWAEDEEG